MVFGVIMRSKRLVEAGCHPYQHHADIIREHRTMAANSVLKRVGANFIVCVSFDFNRLDSFVDNPPGGPIRQLSF